MALRLSSPSRIFVNTRRLLDAKYELLRISLLSLCYNSFHSKSTLLDGLVEPMFFCVDKLARYFGPIFVGLVIIGTASVVAIFYIFILPWVYETSFLLSAFHTIFGHWLLINIVFNYYMALITPPGTPPSGHLVCQPVSICKKCISPKPARTHHCSMCGCCILKMDHHCPWLNSCVGHFNHRYFFMFCVYMWVGTVYVCIADWPLFRDHFFNDVINGFLPSAGNNDIVFMPGVFLPLPFWSFLNIFKSSAFKEVNFTSIRETMAKAMPDQMLAGNLTNPMLTDFRRTHPVTHFCIIIEFVLCAGVAVALGALTAYHFRLISRAETSIETYINSNETKRLRLIRQVYKNPYDYGFSENWRIFLGLENGRTFWKHIILPSRHKARGDGLTWVTTTYTLPENRTTSSSDMIKNL